MGFCEHGVLRGERGSHLTTLRASAKPPFAELLAGGLVCLGLRVREAGIVLGLILISVTYGHLLQQALFDTTSHIFPRLVLLTFVLCAPSERDRLGLDYFLFRRDE